MPKFPRLLAITVSLMLVLGCSGLIHSAAAKKGSKGQYQVYENKRFGFTLQIPVVWNGYYIVRDFEDSIEVDFVGKSKKSKNYSADGKIVQGLELFCIGNKKALDDVVDSVTELGVAGGKKYYFFRSGTDSEIAYLEDEYFDPPSTEEERKLQRDDFLKAKQMLEDVPRIIATFRAKTN